MKTPPQIATLQLPDRPMWSVMIPVYNCADFLIEALNSVLQQEPGVENMHIEVIDDGSTEADIKKLVESVGKGRILYFRQKENVGSLKNLETCLNRSKGHIVHILHGDDKLRPGFYKKMEQLFMKNPTIGAAFCHYDYIDEKGKIKWDHPSEISTEGVLPNWLLQIAEKQYLQTCTIAVKREVYENLGGFYGVHYGEDWEMWARIAANYEVAYTKESLAEYRQHNNSISSKYFINGKNIEDIKWVINTILKNVPEENREIIRKKAFRHYAHYALTIANSLWHTTKSHKITSHQIKEAFKLHKDFSMLLKTAKIYLKIIVRRV